LDAAFLVELCRTEAVSAIVVGLPMHTDGREGKKAVEARAFGRWVADITKLPVEFFDERFTTIQAERTLLQAGLTHKRRKLRRDRVAAQLMLQGYLEWVGGQSAEATTPRSVAPSRHGPESPVVEP
jgi:putative Holliday junction resolvase